MSISFWVLPSGCCAVHVVPVVDEDLLALGDRLEGAHARDHAEPEVCHVMYGLFLFLCLLTVKFYWGLDLAFRNNIDFYMSRDVEIDLYTYLGVSRCENPTFMSTNLWFALWPTVERNLLRSPNSGGMSTVESHIRMPYLDKRERKIGERCVSFEIVQENISAAVSEGGGLLLYFILLC